MKLHATFTFTQALANLNRHREAKFVFYYRYNALVDVWVSKVIRAKEPHCFLGRSAASVCLMLRPKCQISSCTPSSLSIARHRNVVICRDETQKMPQRCRLPV